MDMTFHALVGYVVLWVVALSCTACSGPMGLAVGKEAIAAKVRITEIEHGVGTPLGHYTEKEKRDLANLIRESAR